MKPQRFGNLTLPQYNASWDIGGGDVRGGYVSTGNGSYRQYGTAVAPPELAPIPYRATEQADTPTALDATLSIWRTRKGAYDKLWCERADGSLWWTWAELTRYREPHTFGPKTIQDLEFAFTPSKQVWYSEVQVGLRFTDLYDATGADLLLMGVMGATPGSAAPTTWVNDGNYQTSDVLITLVSGTGTNTKLRIENTTPGYESALEWNGTLTTGQTLIIDAGSLLVTKQGLGVYGELTTPTNRAEWLMLAPGVNQVSITIDDTATDDSTALAVLFYSTSA